MGCYSMSRTLRHVGLIVLAATVWLLLADALGWVPDGTSDPWFWKGIALGLACLAAGLVFRLFAPLSREMTRDHCIHCGAPTERGHLYCRDHLKMALDDARDRTRKSLQARGGPEGPGFSSS